LRGKEIYERLEKLLKIHLQGIKDEADQHTNETLLGFYMKEWDQYVSAAKSNNHMFKYVNRSWVKWEIQEGKKDVCDVYTLHIILWKEVVVAATSGDIADALVQFMETPR
jgi:cullin 1